VRGNDGGSGFTVWAGLEQAISTPAGHATAAPTRTPALEARGVMLLVTLEP